MQEGSKIPYDQVTRQQEIFLYFSCPRTDLPSWELSIELGATLCHVQPNPVPLQHVEDRYHQDSVVQTGSQDDLLVQPAQAVPVLPEPLHQATAASAGNKAADNTVPGEPVQPLAGPALPRLLLSLQ